jgi:hypothetical protein
VCLRVEYDGEQGYLQTTVQGARTVKFCWRSWGDQYGSHLAFYTDDSATSEGWRVQWEAIPPGQKSETCSLDDRQEGNRML